jgi:hypothetical protein
LGTKFLKSFEKVEFFIRRRQGHATQAADLSDFGNLPTNRNGCELRNGIPQAPGNASQKEDTASEVAGRRAL